MVNFLYEDLATGFYGFCKLKKIKNIEDLK